MNRRTDPPRSGSPDAGGPLAPFPAAPVARGVRAWLSVLATGLLVAPGWALAQSGDGDETPVEPGARLKSSRMLEESLPEEALREAPVFISGDRIEGKTDGVTAVEGSAELRRHNIVIKGDRLQLDQPTNDARATGNVLINRNGERFQGPDVQINLDTYEGTFTQPTFELLKNNGKGDASRLEFLGKDRTDAYDARYSTCPRTPGADWMPAWLVRASRIEFDNVEEIGKATNGVLEFQGVPILGSPYFTFPLTDARKSGLLPPTLNLDNISGLELTVPYYLNIAPNLDATLYPTFMSKRGIDLGGELRYLQPTYSGQIRGAYMPSDQLRDADRWGYSYQHNQNLTGTGLALGASSSLYVNLNRVSDDDYWRDFPRATTSLTTRLLANDVVASWGYGPWSMSAGAYTWQTLQDVDAPITPPYDRLPMLTLRYGRSDARLGGLGGWDWSISNELTRFHSNPLLTSQTNGTRAMMVAEISRRWLAPGWFVKPRAQLHSTYYSFDSPLSNGARSATRVLPTFSLDSGLVFERDASYLGRNFVQTLEPRAFFTWTPYRDQSLLPNYDSGLNDFNLASIFSENVFGGNDRISDTRALTLGVSSRLLDPGTGAEMLRVGVAQRYLFRDQNVYLPRASGQPGGDPVKERLSDILVATRVQWSPSWALDTNVQFNPSSRESVRTTLGGRYTPGPYRVFSAAYRLLRGSSEQFDIGWQWPLNDLWGESARDRVPGGGLGAGQWYSVGRVNYSVPDKKVVDLVAGFEYDAGCWLGRIVVERLQRSGASANQRILFQLEFSGFSRLGSNPLRTLKENVPRYQYLREEINPPSRFQQYD
ncbi:LPS-assembly protein LptD [Hydrogenophaga sp.]|uniref:LPS-assembly protein LptD n=1 Tax=Hydrogenophaga sp. TaxID=1904254 RepID=UPI002635E0A6|nr:LPS-assembly protein LptD [Hydrogenophaga sp.]